MKLKACNVVLFIEPANVDSYHPLIDNYTKRMTYALRNPEEKDVVVSWNHKGKGIATIHKEIRTMGIHYCKCGAKSESADYGLIADKLYTNSLAIHYLAYHRSSVSEEELKVIGTLPLPDENIIPTDQELNPPESEEEKSIRERETKEAFERFKKMCKSR